MLREGSRTPWGAVQDVQELEEGIVWVSTASHGGFRLTATRNRRIPEYMREGSNMREAGWYEEDCDAALVAAVFPVARRMFASPMAFKDTFRNWFPDQYERFYGVHLVEGQSFKRDEALFHKRHADDWVVISAVGDWHPEVPEGMVGVYATTGGRRNLHAIERRFLIPADEYQKGDPFGFVVDLKRHKPWKGGV